MKLKRMGYLLSLDRFRACQRLAEQPVRTFINLGFVSKRPFSVNLRSGGRATFSGKGRDHKLWDWLLEHPEATISFTPDEQILLRLRAAEVLLRPGTEDFLIFQEIFLEDTYGLAKLPDKLDTVVDLGGNVGLFSVALLPRARRVITVEPQHDNRVQACKNIARNGGLASNVLPYAIAARSHEQVLIHHNARNSGGHSIVKAWAQPESDAPHEAATTRSLSDLFAETNCTTVDLLKCDVEGAEYEIFLHSSAETIKRIRHLLMEIHLSEAYAPVVAQRLITHLQEAGMTVQLDAPLPDEVGSQRITRLLTARAG